MHDPQQRSSRSSSSSGSSSSSSSSSSSGSGSDNKGKEEVMLMLNISTETKFVTPPPRDGVVGPDLKPHRPPPTQGDIMAMNNGDSNTEGYWQGRERTHLDGKQAKWKSMKDVKRQYSRGKNGPKSGSKRKSGNKREKKTGLRGQ